MPCVCLGWLYSYANHALQSRVLQAIAVMSQQCRNCSCTQKSPAPLVWTQPASSGLLICIIFMQKCSHRENTDKGTEEGAQPCKSS